MQVATNNTQTVHINAWEERWRCLSPNQGKQRFFLAEKVQLLWSFFFGEGCAYLLAKACIDTATVTTQYSLTCRAIDMRGPLELDIL